MSTGKPVNIVSPLGDDVLLFYRMDGHEELGRLFRYHVQCLSVDPELDGTQILGEGVTIVLDLVDGGQRYFNGVCTQFAQTGRVGRYVKYEMTLRPWFWLLTRTSDCTIYPDQAETNRMSIPEIVKAVFRKHDMSDFEESLNESYEEPREFCVQYRETDFNFASRLMEEEGMYYFFKHEEERHVMVLADGPTSHEVIEGCESVPFITADENTLGRQEHIYEWNHALTVQSGKFATSDFDFEVPTKDNLVEAEDPKEHTHAEFQMFDYPGVFVEAYDAEADGEKGDTYAGARGERFARYRMEEMSSKFERVSGDSNMRLLTLGGMFTMADFHRQDQNREHTIVKITYQISLGGYEAEDSSSGEVDYSCSFEAIPSAGVFRTERTTPTPYIRGPQTAIVVGKEEKEIWTDMHGRVKVKFPWDRKDTTDETSSCWVRVAQVWAGQGWGALHVPRVGQEVIVEFIDGNPNRPIITGRVYNGDNMSPYSLPGSATQSGIKSRSTEEGTDENFNEIRFEDLKDSEEMYIHAEKDQNTVVENDQSTDVGNDQTIHVVKNRNENIDGSRTLVVGEEKEETIEGGKTINVTGGHEETIKGAMAVDVGESRNLVVGASSVEEITDDLTISVGKERTDTVGEAMTLTVTGKLTDTAKDGRESVVKGNYEIGVTENMTVGVEGNLGHEVTKDYTLSAKNITLEAEEKITIKVGDAKITMESSGDIKIEAAKFKMDGSDKAIIKGSKVSIKP